MKKLLYLSLILSGLFIASCKNKNVTQRTVITGQVANTSLYPETKEFKLQVKSLGDDTATYTGVIEKDGSFKISFDQYIAQDISLTPIVRTFIAHPGDSIHIAIDFAHMDEVVFSGDAAKTNNDLYQYLGGNYAKYDDQDEAKKSIMDFIKTNDIKSIIDLNKEIKDKMIDKREEFIVKYDPNSEVKTWTKNYININYYVSTLRYVKGIAIKQNKSSDDLNKMEGLNHLAEDVDEIYHSGVLNTDAYNLSRMLLPLIDKKLIPKTEKDALTRLAKVNINNNDTLIKQMVIGMYFKSMLRNNEIDEFNKKRSQFDKYVTMPFIKQPLLKYYAVISKNSDHPEIRSTELLSNVAKTSIKGLIDSIKEQNAGKVILIDVWATWCAPCIAEFHYSKRLMEYYKDKDAKFVFLCTNSDKKLYNQYAANLKPAQHYFLGKEQTKSLLKAFNISGIPYKIIINKKGVIAETGNLQLTPSKIDRQLAAN